jgi:hypothetical protein
VKLLGVMPFYGLLLWSSAGGGVESKEINWKNLLITASGLAGMYWRQSQQLRKVQARLERADAKNERLIERLAKTEQKLVRTQERLTESQQKLDHRQTELDANTSINTLFVDALIQQPEKLREMLARIPPRKPGSAGSGDSIPIYRPESRRP